MDFHASLDNLYEMMLFIEGQAVNHNLDSKVIQKMQLACEEAIVNIISYAYPKEKGNIAIDCERKGDRFEVILRDQGVPFNPVDVDINPQLDIPVSDRQIGGLGIFLIRKIIDEAIYQRLEHENLLRLVFSI